MKPSCFPWEDFEKYRVHLSKRYALLKEVISRALFGGPVKTLKVGPTKNIQNY
jgi:hypothetical protein